MDKRTTKASSQVYDLSDIPLLALIGKPIKSVSLLHSFKKNQCLDRVRENIYTYV